MTKRVLVGMSGGVDSSMAAALLREQGYDVIGITLKLYDYAKLNFEPPDGGCCTIDLINDARLVCDRLGVPHYVIDLQRAFEKTVIDDFINSYSHGRTPNPCINCNRFIKWGEMLKTADKLGCDLVATGHYARVMKDEAGVRLFKAVDTGKDQSYALWGIPLEALNRTILPIGLFTKAEIREKARKYGFRNADRPDSQEICFVPAGDYAAIIGQRRRGDSSLQPGPIYDVRGNKLGEHKGYAYFTIGQRKGFGIAEGVPLYVTRINPDDQSITVGTRDHLLARQFSLIDINLLIKPEEMPDEVDIKIRYRHGGGRGHAELAGYGATVTFDQPERAITPGQSAVFYDGDRVLGGGVIDRVLD
ncbi:MAG: tRNA 2-thiouridine(34) synthase MnmA [candidate division Zixibacteria bacterium RBG_16_53_22]|nr:MAG: tRNA 2-thiouridine(34) synthase MnmA [candidate division Zixibacteria bacterium RBG_16_53_22]